jgi:serine/threonine protein kinase
MTPRRTPKNKKSNINRTKKIKKTLKKVGGRVIGSGGYGCIFKPALKCRYRDRDSSINESQISKLMLSKNAKNEYKDIVKFLPYLKKIPNYQRFFLVENITICEPHRLTDEDLEGFDEKCKTLRKKEITERNINEPSTLKKLAIVNMPFGGIDIGDYIDQEILVSKRLDFKRLVSLNESLLDVLKHGIIPMNKEDIYHCDLKEANMLLGSDGNIRLIDWGLSCKYDGEDIVPKVLNRRPFQYNVPFSNILFSDVFSSLYKKFLAEKKAPTYLETREFVIDFVFFWLDERGPGHIKGINNIVKLFFENSMATIDEEFKEQLLEFNYTFHFIFEYITKILMKFTRNGKFDKFSYLKVFLKNVDIWGFVISYIPIVEVIMETGKIGPIEIDIIKKIKDALVLIYESSDEEINISKLTTILESLNPIFRRGVSSYPVSSKRSERISKKSYSHSPSSIVEMVSLHNRTAKGFAKRFKKSKTLRAKSRSLIRSLYRNQKRNKSRK